MNKKSPRKHFRGVQIIGILQKLFFDDLGEGFAPKLSFGKFGILCVLRAFQNVVLRAANQKNMIAGGNHTLISSWVQRPGQIAKGEFLEVPYRLGT